MQLQIRRPYSNEINNIKDFFKLHLENNDAVYNQEFLCPLGLIFAFQNRQIIIAKSSDNKIIGALRFYKRKGKPIASLYQFAIHKNYRKNNLLFEMLKKTKCSQIISQCPQENTLNQYYLKTGWQLTQTKNKYNYWALNLE